MDYVRIIAIVILTWETKAIATKEKNFRRHVGEASPPINWELGLRESVHQALLREHYNEPELHEHLLAAPLLGRKDSASPFGDIAVLARGQLYLTPDGYKFVQDTDCDCYGDRCEPSQCHVWEKLGHHHKLLALWTVKRIRHRDPHYGHVFEMEYTISPMTEMINEDLVMRQGHFNYNVPGHIFVMKSSSKVNQEFYEEKWQRDRPPGKQGIIIGVGPNGFKHILHSYPGFYTSYHPQNNYRDETTIDPKEYELYKKLIESLAAKTTPHRFAITTPKQKTTTATYQQIVPQPDTSHISQTTQLHSVATQPQTTVIHLIPTSSQIHLMAPQTSQILPTVPQYSTSQKATTLHHQATLAVLPPNHIIPTAVYQKQTIPLDHYPLNSQETTAHVQPIHATYPQTTLIRFPISQALPTLQSTTTINGENQNLHIVTPMQPAATQSTKHFTQYTSPTQSTTTTKYSEQDRYYHSLPTLETPKPLIMPQTTIHYYMPIEEVPPPTQPLSLITKATRLPYSHRFPTRRKPTKFTITTSKAVTPTITKFTRTTTTADRPTTTKFTRTTTADRPTTTKFTRTTTADIPTTTEFQRSTYPDSTNQQLPEPTITESTVPYIRTTPKINRFTTTNNPTTTTLQERFLINTTVIPFSEKTTTDEYLSTRRYSEAISTNNPKTTSTLYFAIAPETNQPTTKPLTTTPVYYYYDTDLPKTGSPFTVTAQYTTQITDESTSASTPTFPSTTIQNFIDDFLTDTESVKASTTISNLKLKNDEDDIFGLAVENKSTTTSTRKPITQSDVDEELFGVKRAKLSSKIRRRPPKIIYKKLINPSNKTTPTPFTTQSFSTSISIKINKRNSSRNSAINGKNAALTNQIKLGKIDQETSELLETSGTKEKSNPKKLFDNAALQLVNHARSIDFLNKKTQKNDKATSKEPKYKRRSYNKLKKTQQ